MTGPSDAVEAVESAGTNDGPREQAGKDEGKTYVDEENVPHPPSTERPTD